MGTTITDWAAVEGAYYTGAGTWGEMFWLLLAVGLCVAALYAGAVHEHRSYKKLKK